MSIMTWWKRFGLSRGRPDPAALEAQALQAAVAERRVVARRSTGIRRALAATGAALLLASGLALGLNSERVPDTDAAYAAYQNGNSATALHLSQPLAEQGDARAQSLLGLIHYNDRGVLRDDAEAVKWSRLAAEQGDATAQFRLGLMYSEGRGVPQDHAEAAKWYRLAADRRHPQAQYNLGLLYATGEGVAQDNVMAHMWLNLAAAQFPVSDTRNRNAAISSRDVVAGKLTREQLAEAQKLARNWQPLDRPQHGIPTS
jgi:TPR repeat protein